MAQLSEKATELANLSDDDLTDELVALILQAKATDNWDHDLAAALGREIASRPALQDLLRSIKQ